MRVLMFSDFGIPDSCAAATRVMNIAKLIKVLGHKVDVLGVSYKNEEKLVGSYDTIDYQMLKAPAYMGVRAYKRVIQLKKELHNYLQNRVYDIVIISNIYYDYADVLRRYAEKMGAHIIVNAVEWYDRNNEKFSGLFGIINYVKNRVALRNIHRKMGNILAISSLLEDYYKKRGCNTITIPTLIDPAEYEGVVRIEGESNIIKIAYAGSPAKKDYIANAILAVSLLSEEERQRLELHLYGPTEEQLESLGISQEYLRKYKKCIVCHGRIPYDQIKAKIAAADFTVLLRADKRYAHAGFPTKVGESMACGTPVIANLTSDLYRYIIDEQTGIVCIDEKAESCAQAFRRALMMAGEEKSALRKNAFDMAQQSFAYDKYVEVFEEFLEKCNVK